MVVTTPTHSPATPSRAVRPDGRRGHRDPVATKQRILEAAERVVLRDGVGHLTLEAAAAESGLSKGGVLYHFPSRDALVAAMVTRIIELFEADIASHLPTPGTPEAGLPGAFARAYIQSTVAPAVDGDERLGAALLAAAAAEPALLVPLQEAADGWQARMVDDGLDPSHATVIRMACDGLWMCDLFQLAAPQGDLRATVATSLEQLTRVSP